MSKFDIYDAVDNSYVKVDCTLQAIIQSNHELTDDEVREYYGVDECHKHWDISCIVLAE